MTRTVLIFSGGHDFSSDARAFSFLASLEILSFSLRLINGFRLPKCLLDLNNSTLGPAP